MAKWEKPDVRSLKPIDAAGFIELSLEELPPEDKGEKTEWAFVKGRKPDDAVHIEPFDYVSEWVGKCVSEPFGPPEKKDVSSIASDMGIEQPEVFRTYYSGLKKGDCPTCGTPKYLIGKPCKKCGHTQIEE